MYVYMYMYITIKSMHPIRYELQKGIEIGGKKRDIKRRERKRREKDVRGREREGARQ